MSKLNSTASQKMHKDSVYEAARKLLVTCLLFEDNTYMDGKKATELMTEYVSQLSEKECRSLLKEAKGNHLRHAPAFWAIKMLKQGYLKAEDVDLVIDRTDIMADLLALYWSDKSNKHSIPKVLAKGIGRSFSKFDEYQLAKYKAEGKEIKLRDVLRIAHVKPESTERSELYKRVLEGTLATPDTWEVALSKCHTPKEKKAEWVRLLTEKTEKGHNKIGALALIRNLNNMTAAGVPEDIIRNAIQSSSMKKLLPYQIVMAAKQQPSYSAELELKLLESMKNYEKLPGDTIFLVDVSGSMYGPANGGTLRMVENAAATAAIVREACSHTKLYTFDTKLDEVPNSYRGMPLIDRIVSHSGGATAVIDCTNEAIRKYRDSHEGKYPARVIVITDEGENSSYGKTLTSLPKKSHGYMVNVASNSNSVTYGVHSNWTNISGWSTSILNYISAAENL